MVKNLQNPLMNVVYIILFSFVVFACNQNDDDTEIEDFSGDSGTFVDTRDNHEYKWVRIDDKIWMAENLAFIPSVYPVDSGSYTEPRYYVYGYNGNEATEAQQNENYINFGVLYNWTAAIAASPPGWHLPSDEEWKELELFLGMTEVQTDSSGFRGIGKGLFLKATTDWNSNGKGIDSIGFTALPGGLCTSRDGFFKLGIGGYWWSASENSTKTAWDRGMYWSNTKVNRFYIDKDYGFSVRCIKD